MKTEKFYKAVILVLLLLNLGTLAFLWFHRPGRERMMIMGGPQGRPFAHMMLKKEIGFSDEQMKQYQALRKEHREAMRSITEADRALHHRFFQLALTKPADAPEVKAMIDSIASMRKMMELTTFRHFAKMVAILTPEQKQKFGPVYERLLQSILEPAGPMGGRGPGMRMGPRGPMPPAGAPLPNDPESMPNDRP